MPNNNPRGESQHTKKAPAKQTGQGAHKEAKSPSGRNQTGGNPGGGQKKPGSTGTTRNR